MIPDQQECSRRLRLLVATHLVLAAAPLVGLMMPFDMATLPIQWALASLSLGSLMTFTVWIGLGKSPLQWRMLAGIAGSCYFAIWPFIASAVRITERMGVLDLAKFFLKTTADFAVVVAVLGGVFILIGRKFELKRLEFDNSSPRSNRFQFPVLYLLLLMLFVAIVLMLLKSTRINLTNQPTGEDSNWRLLAILALMLIAFLTIIVCAVFAALRPGAIGIYVGLVFIVALIFGVVVAFATNNDQTGVWQFIGMSSTNVITTIVVLASLLVVRSCGYRLVRRDGTTR